MIIIDLKTKIDLELICLAITVKRSNAQEGIKTSWRRTTLLVLAVTLHNISEGLAGGVAFGASVAASFSFR